MTPTERAQVRQQHIADREVSGVSGSAYCKRHVMRHRYIRPSLSLPEIYLYRAPVDFRKQAQGLAFCRYPAGCPRQCNVLLPG